jgi:hypothetical protein
MVAQQADAINERAGTGAWSRWAPLSGIGFVVFFLGSVFASNPPANDAPDSDWIASYADKAHQASHLVTGYCLVFAGLCLMTLFATLWMRIAAAGGPGRPSPLPLLSAAVSAACIAAGGVVMAFVGGAMIFGGLHTPGADVLRLANDLGFGLVGVAGMLAAALTVVILSVQARAAGLFGPRLLVGGYVVGVFLLAAPLFIPILALLVWLIVVTIVLMRSGAAAVSTR